MSATISLSDALRSLQAQGLERLDAQMLLLTAINRPPNDRAWLLSHDTDPLPLDAATRLVDFTKRRLHGEPMAYIQGEKAFFGLTLQVDSRVLVPRPDTETLVQWGIELIGSLPGSPQFLDLGTGSGAIALAVKSQCAPAQVTATDASSEALSVAKDNAQRLKLEIHFAGGDWFDAVPGARFDVIASNPPYIAEGDHHLAALTHEPISALTSGGGGLDDLRKLIEKAPKSLNPGGWLLLEHGYDQANAVCALLRSNGFEHVSSRADLAGIARCSGGQWPVGR